MSVSKDVILNRILNKGLKDNLEICSCNGMSICDFKKQIFNIKEFKSFDEFVSLSGCGDVCEFCQTKEKNNGGTDISLEEIYYG